ncbi:MAG: 3-deoxy-D-manno-octulosonic-acid transferase [Planctomycetota bacterium]
MFVSKSLYNLSLQLYYLIALLISPFNKKASLWVEGRNIPIPKIEGESIWFHCASLGEFEQARPLLEQIKIDYPRYKIVLSFYSPSGYEIRKNYKQADYVFYLPLDSKKNAQDFINKINPKAVFFIKYEFWFHYLNELNNENIPSFLVSGIFREHQIFFKWHGILFKTMLKNFKHIFVQDDNSLQLLKSIKINHSSIAEDSRFDRVIDIKNDAKDLPKIQNFVQNKKCIILGSSWLVDDKMFAQLLEELNEYKIIIAPHDINKFRIKEVSELFKESVLYSEVKEKDDSKQVLIIDNMGMLSSIYRYATIAYIGGGFGVSIHNILEAAVYSIPVIFGPAHTKMKEASDLITNGGAFCVNNLSELRTILKKLDNNFHLQKSAETAGLYVHNNTGGTKKVLSFLINEKILKK